MASPKTVRRSAPGPEDPVAAVMRVHWASTTPHASLFEAERLMRLARIRQVPVLVDDILVGVLGHRELVRTSLSRLLAVEDSETRARLLGSLAVSGVMDPRPATATADESIRTAALRMLESGAACLPVVDGAHGTPGRMRGIVVESDLLQLAYRDGAVS